VEEVRDAHLLDGPLDFLAHYTWESAAPGLRPGHSLVADFGNMAKDLSRFHHQDQNRAVR
jgi:hypothetical protein